LLGGFGDQPDLCQFPAPVGHAGQRAGRRDTSHGHQRDRGHTVSGASLAADHE